MTTECIICGEKFSTEKGKNIHVGEKHTEELYGDGYKDEETLRHLYHTKNFSARDIGDMYGISGNSVLYWMDKLDIERRGQGGDNSSYDYVPMNVMWGGGSGGAYIAWRDTQSPDNPQVYVHRLLAVSEYGFDELKGKDVHHINGIKWDNRPDNIEVLSRSEHMKEHAMNSSLKSP